MKKVKEFFRYYDCKTAVSAFCICSALCLFIIGTFMGLAYSDATWLWMWLAAILLVSFNAGMW